MILFHDDVITPLFYFNFDLPFLVVHFKDAEFLCIDELLQGGHIRPQHPFEIIAFIDHFAHFSPHLMKFKGSVHISILRDEFFSRFLRIPGREDRYAVIKNAYMKTSHIKNAPQCIYLYNSISLYANKNPPR